MASSSPPPAAPAAAVPPAPAPLEPAPSDDLRAASPAAGLGLDAFGPTDPAPLDDAGGWIAGVSCCGDRCLAMAPTRAFSTPISTGERLTAAQANALDNGQFAALVRDGTAALTAASQMTLGAYDYTVDATGAGRFKFKDAWPQVSGTIATLTDYVPAACTEPSDATKWDAKGHYWESNATGSHTLYHHLCLPTGLVITSLSLVLLNASAVGLPATLPLMQFSYQAVSNVSSTTVVGSVSDNPAGLAAYQAAHVLTLSGLSHTVETGRRYFLVIQNETGAGAQAGLRLYRPYLTGTLATLRPA